MSAKIKKIRLMNFMKEFGVSKKKLEKDCNRRKKSNSKREKKNKDKKSKNKERNLKKTRKNLLLSRKIGRKMNKNLLMYHLIKLNKNLPNLIFLLLLHRPSNNKNQQLVPNSIVSVEEERIK